MLDAVLVARLPRLVAVPRADFSPSCCVWPWSLTYISKKARDKYFAQLFVGIRDN
jgi:hypothetical protein